MGHRALTGLGQPGHSAPEIAEQCPGSLVRGRNEGTFPPLAGERVELRGHIAEDARRMLPSPLRAIGPQGPIATPRGRGRRARVRSWIRAHGSDQRAQSSRAAQTVGAQCPFLPGGPACQERHRCRPVLVSRCGHRPTPAYPATPARVHCRYVPAARSAESRRAAARCRRSRSTVMARSNRSPPVPIGIAG